jgi:hypothetical protein
MPRVSLAIVRSQRRFHPPPTISGLSLEAGLELRETGLAHISCVFLANQRGITRIARPCGSSPWFSTTDFANHASPPSGVPASHASSVSPRIVLTRPTWSTPIRFVYGQASSSSSAGSTSCQLGLGAGCDADELGADGEAIAAPSDQRPGARAPLPLAPGCRLRWRPSPDRKAD